MSTDTATMENIAEKVAGALLYPKGSRNTQDMESIKRRRFRRERLLMVRLIVSKFLLITTIVSIVLMMTNTQLILINIYPMCTERDMKMKTAVTGLTGFLILLIWLYNYIQLEIFRNIRNIRSFSIALQVSPRRIMLTILETIAAIPHPIPVCFGHGESPDQFIVSDRDSMHRNTANSTTFNNSTVFNNNTTFHNASYNDTDGAAVDIVQDEIIRLHPVESVLSILMFVRLYQIARFTVLHSKLFRTMLSYSLGALTQTKYNFSFIFKSYMAIYKGYFLGVVAFTFTVIAAWCIYVGDRDVVRFVDSLWVVYITFFTVGYGDISPVSVCSRILAVLIGFSGMFFMGISVTVLSRYLQLTYDEYCMLSFFIDADLQKKLRESSANIIRAAWLQYKECKTPNTIASFNAQRNLIKALHYKKYLQYQRISGKERRERQVPLYDMKEQMKKLTIRTEHVIQREIHIEDSVETMTTKLQAMQEKLVILYKLVQKEKHPSLKTASSLSVES